MAKSVFSLNGASVFRAWPQDSWSSAFALTSPERVRKGVPMILLEDNDEFLVNEEYEAGVLYRIIDRSDDEIIIIGETGDTLFSRQYQRIREPRWVDYSRSRPLDIQVMIKSERSKINREEAESAYITNFRNQHGGRLPFMNKRDQYPKKVTKRDWAQGIRALARDIDQEGVTFGLRNTSRGIKDEPNELWTENFPLIEGLEKDRIRRPIQVLHTRGGDKLRVILGFSDEAIYWYASELGGEWKYHNRIPYSMMFIDEDGSPGYLEYGTKRATGIWTGEPHHDYSALIHRIVDISLRTDWR